MAFSLENPELKTWATRELQGYDASDPDFPDYRRIPAQAKGFFIGPGGSSINEQPLPPAALKAEHRHLATTYLATQPIASYETIKPEDQLMVPWPANLTVFYQSSFFDGDLTLNRAWQEIPSSALLSIPDTVKTRALLLMLELRKQSEASDVEVQALPPSTVQTLIQLTIIGGNNVIGNVKTFVAQTVHAGDLESLRGVLTALGIGQDAVEALLSDLREDRATQPSSKGLGTRTLEWIKRNATTARNGAVNVSVDVATDLLTEALKQFLGL